MELSNAKEIASEFADSIKHVTKKLVIAGSISRQVLEVKDIEICALPKFRETGQLDMFGDAEVKQYDMLHEHLNGLQTLSYTRGSKWGKRYKQIEVVGQPIKIDLFSVPDPAEWGLLVFIRTGSASFNRNVMQWLLQKGMHVTGNRLHNHPKLDAFFGEEPEPLGQMPCPAQAECEHIIPTPTEEHFFEAIGIPFVAPQHRSEGRFFHAVQPDHKGYQG